MCNMGLKKSNLKLSQIIHQVFWLHLPFSSYKYNLFNKQIKPISELCSDIHFCGTPSWKKLTYQNREYFTYVLFWYVGNLYAKSQSNRFCHFYVIVRQTHTLTDTSQFLCIGTILKSFWFWYVQTVQSFSTRTIILLFSMES